MGDYVFGYSEKPDLNLTDALAASAAFPGLIGPLVLGTRAHSWVGYKAGSTNEVEPIEPAFKKVHLWDGGVYDNLGVEALYDQGGGYREGVDFLIVSDASGKPKLQKYKPIFQPAHRLVSIAMDQVRSLRARSVVGHLREDISSGRYLQIDNSCSYILGQAGLDTEIDRHCKDYLSEDEVKLAAGMDTTIRRLTGTEFERLFRHGFEVTDLTLHAYAPTKYPVMGYSATQRNDKPMHA
jgi:NTE family protein